MLSEKSGINVLMTKATHCSNSPALEVVVQGLAILRLGWGCPALGASVKGNLPGVIDSIVEENIICLFIVCMTRQRFAANILRFSTEVHFLLSRVVSEIWDPFIHIWGRLGFMKMHFRVESVIPPKKCSTAGECDLVSLDAVEGRGSRLSSSPSATSSPCSPPPPSCFHFFSKPTGFAAVCWGCTTVTSHNVARPVGLYTSHDTVTTHPHAGSAHCCLQTPQRQQRTHSSILQCIKHHANPCSRTLFRGRQKLIVNLNVTLRWPRREGEACLQGGKSSFLTDTHTHKESHWRRGEVRSRADRHWLIVKVVTAH